MMMRLLRFLLAFTLLLGSASLSVMASAMGQAPGEADALQVTWPKDRITIESPPDFTGRMIDVELAVTPRQRQIGLMFRKSMPENHGMLFIFDEERPQSFWMKNTYIPLDMIFIDSSGTVVHVHKGARPLDQTVIHSQKPAMAVLEVNAGAAERMGIVTGSHIRHEAFQSDKGE